ncbi:Aldo-keto reductase [Mycena sanguinolenta]|uniref:Aldo-keto reductase n=1 Tax=Mycena sanguinolenta TaxID=230812 RepID=A0A8H7CUE0_9AGAR|nr:Aldo-keto reductase [Mycena sanguinolenta]
MIRLPETSTTDSDSMTWKKHKLNDGYEIPGLAFGTWRIGRGEVPTSQVRQAVAVGVSHIDTAQLYRNETETGVAIQDSKLSREEIFIITKYSRIHGLDIQTSIRNSLEYLDVSYVDLYLIHFPRAALPDIPTIWKEMEDIQSNGMTRSIGASNFDVDQLTILLRSARVKPAVNQILLHPYVYTQQLPILEYAAEHQIVIEAYSVLIPITSLPGGPLDEPLAEISNKHDVTPDQVLLAWTKAKGAVVVTQNELQEIAVGRISQCWRFRQVTPLLSEEDIAAIDAAGAKGPPPKAQR